VTLATPKAPTGGLAALLPLQLTGEARWREAEAAAAEEQKAGETLRIAWQYRRYIKAQQQQQQEQQRGPAAPAAGSRAPASQRDGGKGSRPYIKDWCHAFDLTRPAGEEALARSRAEVCTCSGEGGATLLLSAAKHLVDTIAEPEGATGSQSAALPAVSRTVGSPDRVGRLAVLSLGSSDWTLGTGGHDSSSEAFGTAVLRTLLALRGQISGTRCSVMVTVPAAVYSPSWLARMQRVADAVIALESVADGSDLARLASDPASVAGLIHVRKLPAMGTVVPPLPESELHLVRNRRRRLAISAVEIDPDAEAAEASGTAMKSVAAALCGGPPLKASVLDF
jgi:elongator complex protein 4